MATKVHLPIHAEIPVKTIKPNDSLRSEWTDKAWAKRKWGVEGVIVSHSDAHGLCYKVKHSDGTEAWYDRSEFKIKRTRSRVKK